MKFYLKHGGMAALQTKRGCAHRCVYCSYPLLEGRIVRSRAVKDVLDDIVSLINEHGAKYIFFTDSVFNDNGNLFLDVLKGMKRHRLTVPWTCFIKPKKIVEEHVLLMKETGLKAVEIGADAASDKALKGMGKDFLFEDIILTNDIFVRNGIATSHSFMFGGPGETKESVVEGVGNIIALRNTVSFVSMGVRILPGTPLEEIARREGLISSGENLLKSVYYFSSSLDLEWLKLTLAHGFKGQRRCFFPADKFESAIKFLHKMGYAGVLAEMLLPDKERTKFLTKDCSQD